MGQPRPEPVTARRQVKPPDASSAVHEPPSDATEVRAGRGQGHPLVNLARLPGPWVRRREPESEPRVGRVGHIGLVGHRGCDLALGVRPIHHAACERPGRQDSPLEHKVNVKRQGAFDRQSAASPSAAMFAHSCPDPKSIA
jgi:hypothetical protein